MTRFLKIAAALMIGSAASAQAQGWIDIERRPANVIAPFPVIRTSSQVRTTIEGRVAKIEVEEQFRNTGGFVAEGTYLYPMPGEAVFSDFSLWMGEQEIRGEVMNAEQARGIYEEIVRRQKDPALLTLEGHGLVRARVFPIQPGETRKVALRYTQLLGRSGDALRLRYSIGQRQRAPARGWGDTPDRGTAEAFGFRVTLPDANVFGTPYSPTHNLTTRRNGGQLIISLDPDASGDVELFLPLRRGLVGTSVVTHAPGGEDAFFMLLLAPPQEELGEVVPRDLTFVVDVSGSMSGDKIEQARSALRQALGTLRQQDRFRLIAFSSTVRHFREGYTSASSENLRAAREFVSSLTANGGTNIADALDAALGSAVAEERLPIVIFLTDGIPSVGEQRPDRIAESASGRIGRSRIFTIGVGHDVNTYLLDRLAAEGHGSAEYVAPDADVELAVGGLISKIRHPALVNLRITDSPVELVQAYPSRLPDLFFGEELVVFGRYRGTGSGDIVIEGERNGRRQSFAARAEFVRNESGNDFIPRLWASRKIGELTRQIRLEGANRELIEQVRELGLRYGILTEYTSYLVQEPAVAQDRLVPLDEVTTRQRLDGSRTERLPVDGRNHAPAQPGMASPATVLGGMEAAKEPAKQTGEKAFERAQASARMMKASNLASADAAARETEWKDSGGAQTKRAGGRLFIQRGGIWIDAAHSDTLRTIEVAPFSEAYFALVRALPEISPYLTVGDEIVIAGRRASIKVTVSGKKGWQAGELQTLVKSFRGA